MISIPHRMVSFFRAVRNEFELNQHFAEDLLDQVIEVHKDILSDNPSNWQNVIWRIDFFTW